MHSLRIDPISRSAYAFCQGERGKAWAISNTNGSNPADEYLAVGAIAVPDQVTWNLLPATRLRIPEQERHAPAGNPVVRRSGDVLGHGLLCAVRLELPLRRQSPDQRDSRRNSARAFWASGSPLWRAMNSSSASAVPFRRANSYSSATAMDGSRGGGRLEARTPLAISFALVFPVIIEVCTSSASDAQLSSPERAASGAAVVRSRRINHVSGR